jgi:hypothetical protein
MRCAFTRVLLDDLPSALTAISYFWVDASVTDNVLLDECHFLEVNQSVAMRSHQG